MRKKSKSAAILAVVMAMTLVEVPQYMLRRILLRKQLKRMIMKRKTREQQRMNLLHAMKANMSL